MKHTLALRFVSLTALLLLLSAVHGQGTTADPAAQKIFDKLLKAIQANDRDAFVADASDAVKEGTTKEVMEALNKQLGGRLKAGFKMTYLCQLKQGGYQVYLWKASFKDDGDDHVFRLALKAGKVEGFFVQ